MTPTVNDTEQIYKTSVILWASLLFSQIIFLGVLFFSKPEVFNFDFSTSPFDGNAILPIIFLFLAVTNLGISFFIKSQTVKKAVAEQNPRLLQTGTILACAFCESVSIMGLILALAFSYPYFFVWFALGIIGIFLHFPRRENFAAANYKKL